MLHLFPEQAKVEEMKQHLCQCLDDYEQKIKRLRTQIEQHSANAEMLRTQKKSLNNKHISVTPNQACDMCFAPAFEREFYVYPCQHAFHRECIHYALQEIDPRDPVVAMTVKQIKGILGEIEAVKAKAHYI